VQYATVSEGEICVLTYQDLNGRLNFVDFERQIRQNMSVGY